MMRMWAPAARRPLGGAAERGERRPEPVGAAGRVPHRVERHGREPRDVPERGHLLGQQHRVLQTEHPGVARPLEQRRAAAAEVHAERHHHRLAQRIDRRVGHLREALPEVRVEALRHRRERRDRRVVAHAPHRVGAGAAHRLEHEPQVLEAVAEAPLCPDERLARVHRRHARGIGHERRHVARHPARVGPPRRDLALGVEVPDHLAPSGVHDQHLAGAHLAALDHLARVEVDQPDLGARDHQAVAPHLVAARGGGRSGPPTRRRARRR